MNEEKNTRGMEDTGQRTVTNGNTGLSDIDVNPQFRFKIVASFSDLITRQLAESVMIERRGMEIFNSMSEYSRCRVPRL